ncbi:MAG: COR domain-containing protein, partial [Chthoniobacteraceae bacterium]
PKMSRKAQAAYDEALRLIEECRRGKGPGLTLRSLGLTALPPEIGQLTALTALYLNDNQLTALPAEIGQLTSLTELDLDNNQLTALHAEIGQLTALTHLFLHNNQLTALPAEIGQLTALRELYLHGNPGLGLPPEVVGPTWRETSSDNPPAKPAAILDHYFSRQAEGARALNEVKLLLVGRGGAGKTSIVERLLRGTFDPKQESTTGIALQDWPLPVAGGETVTAHVWDFAGQVIAHATHQFFFSSRSVYVLVLTGREDAQLADAEYWLRLIRAFGTHTDGTTEQPVTSRVVVALNKWDEAPVRLDREALREKYPFIAGFVETDCRSGLGLDELKAKLAEIIGADEGVRAKVGAEFSAVKDELRKRWKHGAVNHMDYGEFAAVCVANGVDSPERQKGFAEMLHRLGLALNYGDDPRIRDTTVLNPHWVTDGIYELLRHAPNARAELTLQSACARLPKEEAKRVMFLIRLMQKYDLAFPLREDEETWLVPQALAASQPVLEPEWHGEATRLRWTYVALPEGLVPRFITRTHTLSEGQPRWLNGAILVLGEARAVVRADASDRRISATVLGPEPARQQLAGTIQAEMRALNGEIKGLDPREELQMQRDPEVWLPVPGLEKAEQKGRPEMDVLTPNGPVEVNATEENNRLTAEDARTEAWKPRVFLSYSHHDDAAKDKLVLKLKVLKAAGLVDWWVDCDISAGAPWKQNILGELERMDVFVLLVSDHALASDFIQTVEVKRALERHAEGKVELVPVILGRCLWKACGTLTEFQALPKGAKPIKDHKPHAHGWHDVADGLMALFQKLKKAHAGESRSRDDERGMR